MAISPQAGKPATSDILDHIPELMTNYYALQPDLNNPEQLISFGTSGHRGSASSRTFNETHIAAVCQALVEYRKHNGYTGPLFMGMDTHALSQAAHTTALEVLIANDVNVVVQSNGRYTPTPVISHAILNYNKGKKNGFADGVVITPSHNPPRDGGFKYNPPNGGPADTSVTKIIQKRANEILLDHCKAVEKITLAKALSSAKLHKQDLIMPYVKDLGNVVDLESISKAGIKLGIDPLGGAAVDYWEPIAEHYQLDLKMVNKIVDPAFAFMHVDKDGKIRMDCSSPYAMSGLIELKDQFDIAFANDPDVDRHGIVTRSAGLMNPNHYLAVAIEYLFTHRPNWQSTAAIGKTLVSSSMIDRVAKDLGRKLVEVPVGFKWFVDGLLSGDVAFGGEESAGASFLRFNGQPWSTDKDGIIMNLLAGEITAVTGSDPSEHYTKLTKQFGTPYYTRIDVPTTKAKKDQLSQLSPDMVEADQLAGETIRAKLTQAPGNGADIGGLKVVTDNGWFAARPSGTEDVYKIYAETFKDQKHLEKILSEAQAIIG